MLVQRFCYTFNKQKAKCISWNHEYQKTTFNAQSLDPASDESKKYHTDFIISFFSSSSFFRLATLKLWLLLTSEWWLSEFDLLFSLCCFGMMGSNTLASCQWNKLWMHIWTREPTVCIQTIYISVMIKLNLHAANIQKQTRRLVWILFFLFLKLNRKWGECYPLVSDCKEQIKLIYHLKRKLWPINLEELLTQNQLFWGFYRTVRDIFLYLFIICQQNNEKWTFD